jgi:hypothetical protein
MMKTRMLLDMLAPAGELGKGNRQVVGEDKTEDVDEQTC